MKDLTPDLAAKALAADLRNVIKKLGDGGNLTTSERELMQRTLASGAAPEELIEARKAHLTRRYITGGKLTPAEIKEAGLPDPATIVHKQTSEAYKKPLAAYAKLYQRDVRNLKRWIADGRRQTPPDLPPFDDPRGMADWFRRVKRREPAGDSLTRFEDEGGDERESMPSTTAEPKPLSTPSPSPSPSLGNVEMPSLPMMQLGDLSSNITSDLGLQQVQALVVALYNQMGVALKLSREKEFNNLIIKWQRAVQTLRAWEKDIIKIQEGRGEVLRTRVINTEIVAMFTTMGHSFFNALKTIIRRFAPQMPEPKQRKLARTMRDQCFAHVKMTRYQQAWSQAQAGLILEAELVES